MDFEDRHTGVTVRSVEREGKTIWVVVDVRDKSEVGGTTWFSLTRLLRCGVHRLCLCCLQADDNEVGAGHVVLSVGDLDLEDKEPTVEEVNAELRNGCVTDK